MVKSVSEILKNHGIENDTMVKEIERFFDYSYAKVPIDENFEFRTLYSRLLSDLRNNISSRISDDLSNIVISECSKHFIERKKIEGLRESIRNMIGHNLTIYQGKYFENTAVSSVLRNVVGKIDIILNEGIETKEREG